MTKAGPDLSPVRPAAGSLPGRDPAARRLDRLVARSRWALAWEQAWPALWWPLGIVLLFLAASWLGLWLDLPPLGRQIGVAIFGVALAASLIPLFRVRPPARPAALDRLDRQAAGAHRPARAFEDALALGDGDSGTRALWALHRRRAEAAIDRLQVAPPRPGMPKRDPHAFRAAALAATVAAAFVAGPEIGSRVGAAFSWSGPRAAPVPFRVDGWIDPPHYTRLPPLMIDGAAPSQALRAPVNSTLVIRFAGRGDGQVATGPGLKALPKPDTAPAKPDLREERFKLTGSTELRIGTGGASGSRIAVEAIPDKPPAVTVEGQPEANSRGTFDLAYRITDDYGVTGAEAQFDKADGAGRRSLVPPPRAPLTLPSDIRGGEPARSTIDLTAHPWAGTRVTLTLVAHDEAEQEGRSAPVGFTLPQRPFTKPLAKALVEQRRTLITDPDQRPLVQVALDALLIAPDRFTPEWGVFMGLRLGAQRLRAARSDADLLEVADWLWAMALQIEDGDLSDAERALRAAQERLREAVERNAGEDEIRKLTDELRTAMDRFLREFAERMQNAPADQQQSARAPDRTISPDDLNRMLSEMQDAMKRGDTAEAQRLLEQLRNILENLRTAQPGNRMSDPAAREMSRQMDELNELSREQQNLRDDTYRQGGEQRRQQRGAGQRPGQRQPGQQGQRGQRGQPGQQGEPGENGEGEQQAEGQGEGGEGQQGQGGGLSQRQQALRDRLQQLQRRMRGMGMQGEQGLADAESAMRDAEGQLGQGQGGQAVDSQGRALEGLQRGMQGMAQQMQQMMGQNEGQGEGSDQGQPGSPQGRAQSDARNDDPLGRPTRSREMSDGRVRIPQAGESAVERARRILEELRRKLGDPTRPPQELDYFERLLRPN